ncbi:MAG TPA: glycosyltransferase family 4 protein [Solirubrobacteraceae bacterium]|nr:glycosyltransferase family 4 protein [Solirubrobacteraceae bacterium]
MTRTDDQTTPEAAAAEPATAAPGRLAARVLVVSQNAQLPRDRRVWNELRALSEGGYEVSAICPKGDDGESTERFERLEGVDIFRFAQPRASGSAGSYLLEYAVAFWRIRRLARRVAGERGFDVVQASNPPDFLLMAVYFLKRRGARLIFDHHDLAPELYLARFGSDHRLLYWLTRLLEQINYRLADLVLATNESYKRVALRRGRRRPEDVFVVRSGPQLARFAPTPADEGLKRGHRFLISFIGEMAPQDGVDHALRALAHLLERRADWYAVFAGDGPAREGLEELAATLGIWEHVDFAGWLADPALRTVLSSSDVCLVPDPKTPLSDVSTLVKVAEYMAMSRPIVSYDLTESRVTAADAALYARSNDPAAFADAINELLDDPERRAQMGRAGRERVEQHLSWECGSAQLLAAYETALERSSEAAGSRRGWLPARLTSVRSLNASRHRTPPR